MTTDYMQKWRSEQADKEATRKMYAAQRARERREWAHGEMELWLNNDQDMYNAYHRIASNPLYGVREAASILKSRYRDFESDGLKLAPLTNWTALVKSCREEHDNKQYGRFESHSEFKAWYAAHSDPYPASRPCHVTVTEVPTLALPSGLMQNE